MAEGAHSAWHRPADDGVPRVLAAAAARPGRLWACWCAPASCRPRCVELMNERRA